MELLDQEELPPEQRIAIAYCGDSVRMRLASFFALDRRLGNIVAKTAEPMLAQMRMAWWREELAKPSVDRPAGDAVLDAIGAAWGGDEDAIQALVDAWEIMAIAERLDEAKVAKFADGRVQPIVRIACLASPAAEQPARISALRWALADAASHTSAGSERDLMISEGNAIARISRRLPRELRGIAILDSLAVRSLSNGGQPLMEGRGAALLALRVGLFAR